MKISYGIGYFLRFVRMTPKKSTFVQYLSILYKCTWFVMGSLTVGDICRK